MLIDIAELFMHIVILHIILYDFTPLVSTDIFIYIFIELMWGLWIGTTQRFRLLYTATIVTLCGRKLNNYSWSFM